jgi:hypothetical protein
MKADKQLNISSLEFDDIKDNIKDFLKGQDTFTDYDFEGSGMSVLLDVMAYTTHYMGFHTNMAVNESFLDTATLRNSVVSHAKALGYTPKSVTAPEAIVKLSFNIEGTAPPSITIPQWTTFVSTINGVSMNFVTSELTNVYPDDQGDFSTEVRLKQGNRQTINFGAYGSGQNGFIIDDETCDRDTISMSNGWYNNTLLSELTPESKVFFMQEGLDKVTELYFGNNIFGKVPNEDEEIEINYLSSKGEEANYTSSVKDQVFSLESIIDSYYDESKVVVETINISSLGSGAETTENIKMTAPRAYERQNRAVTAEDYKTILIEKYPNIDSISVWGGEDNDPPQYGAVFISIKPKHGLELSPITKKKLTDEVLSKYNMLAINPIITAPEYTYLDIETTVKYDPLITTKSSGDIQMKIIEDIKSFIESEISQFKVTLRYSQLTMTIDHADIAISNNLTSVKMYKKFFIQASNTTGNYIFKFNNAIKPGTAVSSVFGNSGLSTQFALLDDGQGNILMYDIVSEVFINTNQGTIDYETGTIELIGFTPILDTNTVISLYGTPQSNDIIAERNNLLVLNNSKVTMVSLQG